jgi:hypothetical protein
MFAPGLACAVINLQTTPDATQVAIHAVKAAAYNPERTGALRGSLPRPSSAFCCLQIDHRSSQWGAHDAACRLPLLFYALKVRVQASGSRHDSRFLSLMITEVLSPGIAGGV